MSYLLVPMMMSSSAKCNEISPQCELYTSATDDDNKVKVTSKNQWL
jgi:hypothetical protein